MKIEDEEKVDMSNCVPAQTHPQYVRFFQLLGEKWKMKHRWNVVFVSAQIDLISSFFELFFQLAMRVPVGTLSVTMEGEGLDPSVLDTPEKLIPL